MNLKNLILAVGIIFIASTTSLAQEIRWGVKAGANLSTLSGGDEFDVESLPGFHAGVVADFRVSERFSLQPELLYSMEGAEASSSFEEPGIAVAAEQKIKLNYLNLPVMGKFFVADGLSLQAGPQIGYLLSGEIDYETTATVMGVTERESDTEDVKDELKKLSLGLNFGLGYEVGTHLFLQARYHLGLSNIDDSEADLEIESEEISNSGFQLSVGYRF